MALCLGSFVAAPQSALAQDPWLCPDPASGRFIGSHPSGEGTIHPGGPAIDWKGPCGTFDRWTSGRPDGQNWHHFYVHLAERGHLGVHITWPDSTDDFDLFVYRGHVGENDPPPPNDQRLGVDQNPGSWLLQPHEGGEKGFLFEDVDAGEYTIRVVYKAVVEGYYRGRVWSPPPVSEVVPPESSGPGERGEYPLEPADPLFERQWGLRKIGAPQAWQEARSTGHGITIAVVDGGLDLLHPDFACAGKMLILPGATIGSKKAPWDSKGHGTHVAGIAGACAGNEEGGAGVAPDATIMPVNATDAMQASDFGPGSNDKAMADGIRFATDKGAHVVNLSIGPPPWEGSHAPEMHPLTKEALRYAHEMGVVVVAAAGNFSSPVCEFPSLSRWVVCVGATDRNDHKAFYSDFPVNVDGDMEPAPSVMAPGGEANEPCLQAAGQELLRGIVSTHLTTAKDTRCGHPSGYRELSGTSMASPFVAGVAALVYDRLGGERSPENAVAVVKAIIENTEDLYTPGWDPLSGFGRVDALAAVKAITPTMRASDLALDVEGPGSSRSTLVATLTDAGSGAALPHQPIEFFADETSLGWATTDESGVASMPLERRFRGARHNFRAVFGGNEQYHGSSGSTQT